MRDVSVNEKKSCSTLEGGTHPTHPISCAAFWPFSAAAAAYFDAAAAVVAVSIASPNQE